MTLGAGFEFIRTAFALKQQCEIFPSMAKVVSLNAVVAT